MSSITQWSPPENPADFMDWLKKYHRKWIKGSEEETLINMLTTSDGLGCKIKSKALKILVNKGK